MPLIVTSTSIYKWWETENDRLDGLHIEYIQIPGASIKELLLALKTEYAMEKRPLDVLVIAGEIDTHWNTGEAIFTDLMTMRNWIRKKNKTNTCAFSTIPSMPVEIVGAPALSYLKIRTVDLNSRIMRQSQIDDLTPPQFNTWGVKETGFEQGSRMRQRTSDWTELLFGDNTRGSNAKCFKQSKIVTQGRACIKFFRVRYELDEKIDRPVHNRLPPEERRKMKNRKRLEQRKARDRRLRQEDLERRESQELAERASLMIPEAADNGNDVGAM